MATYQNPLSIRKSHGSISIRSVHRLFASILCLLSFQTYANCQKGEDPDFTLQVQR